MVQQKQRKGFSLVELSVVVIIIGVLAAFGVPRLLKSVERSKASEAFKYCASVRAAQERYQARQGTYVVDLTQLDMTQVAPKYFTLGVVAALGAFNVAPVCFGVPRKTRFVGLMFFVFNVERSPRLWIP